MNTNTEFKKTPPNTFEILSRTIESERAYYRTLWNSLKPAASWEGLIDTIINGMVMSQQRYEKVAKTAGNIPWYVVAIIHRMEGSGSFFTHLHNGDPLTGYTTHVPAGRPKVGRPPFSWEESAVDALLFDGIAAQFDWTIEGIGFAFEKFNGFGYRSKGIVSPYLAAQSNMWTKGKYIADGTYDPNAGSSQIGALVYLKRMVERGIVTLQGENVKQATWFSFYRNEDGTLRIGAMNGGDAVDVKDTRFVEELVDFLASHRNAKTLIMQAPNSKRPEKPLEPTPKPTEGIRQRVLAKAIQEASKGRSHAPGNEIDQIVLDPLRPIMVKLGHLGSSERDSFWNWCAAWVTHVLRSCDVKVPDQPKGWWASVALVDTWRHMAKQCGAWKSVPQAGDIVVYDWDGDDATDHIGIVEVVHPSGNIRACEGNRQNKETRIERAKSDVAGYIDIERLVSSFT